MIKKGLDPSHYDKIDWDCMESSLPNYCGIKIYTKIYKNNMGTMAHTQSVTSPENKNVRIMYLLPRLTGIVRTCSSMQYEI